MSLVSSASVKYRRRFAFDIAPSVGDFLHFAYWQPSRPLPLTADLSALADRGTPHNMVESRQAPIGACIALVANQTIDR